LLPAALNTLFAASTIAVAPSTVYGTAFVKLLTILFPKV